MIKYVTTNELNNTIRKNIWKIPRDIDFIIGVPRSGMIAASIISEFLNVPLIDINSYVSGAIPSGGFRLSYNKIIQSNRILVVDDTIASGRSMNEAKGKLLAFNKNVEYIYCCIYLEFNGQQLEERRQNKLIYLEDLRSFPEKSSFKLVLYEWNILQHHPNVMNKCLFDIDGVFCLDPPDERNEDNYLNYIKNPKPLFIPKTTIGGIATYRLIKNKEITENWLSSVGIKYNEIYMFNANSWDERYNSGISPERFKGEFYKNKTNYQLFIESNDNQAQGIYKISNKPVYCIETNKLYQ